MSIQAKLIIDDKEIKVLSYSFTFKQGADSTGRPATKPVFTGIRVVVESQSDVDYTEWAIANNQTKLVKLKISPIILGGKTRTLLSSYFCS